MEGMFFLPVKALEKFFLRRASCCYKELCDYFIMITLLFLPKSLKDLARIFTRINRLHRLERKSLIVNPLLTV
jgi:hypothetical protein